jgi:aspartate aminotransferase
MIRNSSDLATYLLEEAKVALVSGDAFGADPYIRLSYATSMENIQKGLDRIEKAVSSLR